MSTAKDLLRNIPKVDALCQLSRFQGEQGVALTEAVRAVLVRLREKILAGEIQTMPNEEQLGDWVSQTLHLLERPSLRRVINGTGVILHTNLGRACLSQQAAKAVTQVAYGYSTLEYDVEKGERGSRYAHVERLLCKLTGAEAAMAVNNNAAAVLLVLSALPRGKEVLLSRGEMVEIGGSFRVPEVMEQGGAILKEVGTTNKTHLSDYAKAITPETGALLKVHTSNYRIMGFTESVKASELVDLAHTHGIPVLEDMGSGALVPLQQFGILDEPHVQQSVQAGIDVITFSGDKMLGGPQAGIIIGKKKYIDLIKKHPLTRAVRIDKLTLAALEATLRSYAQDRAQEEVPVIAMLSATRESLRPKADKLFQLLQGGSTYQAELVEEFGQVGGGSVPTQLLPSWAVAITPKEVGPELLEARLRTQGDIPIVGRIYRGRYLLDVRTLFEEDFPYLVQSIHTALGE